MQVQILVADAERMLLELLPRRGEPPQVEVADPRGFGRRRGSVAGRLDDPLGAGRSSCRTLATGLIIGRDARRGPSMAPKGKKKGPVEGTTAAAAAPEPEAPASARNIGSPATARCTQWPSAVGKVFAGAQ